MQRTKDRDIGEDVALQPTSAAWVLIVKSKFKEILVRTAGSLLISSGVFLGLYAYSVHSVLLGSGVFLGVCSFGFFLHRVADQIAGLAFYSMSEFILGAMKSSLLFLIGGAIGAVVLRMVGCV